MLSLSYHFLKSSASKDRISKDANKGVCPSRRDREVQQIVYHVSVCVVRERRCAHHFGAHCPPDQY